MIVQKANGEGRHRWSGWPGAWCLDCGMEDPIEWALTNGWDPKIVKVPECPEPGSGRNDPYDQNRGSL